MIFQLISGVIITALGVAIFLLALRLGRHPDNERRQAGKTP
jgi:hypothetical protein